MNSNQETALTKAARDIAVSHDGSLLLLFLRERTPDHDTLVSAIEDCEDISIGNVDREAGLIEVVRDGMIFELVGTCGPGEPAIPPIDHRFGYEGELLLHRKRALALRPGAHVEAGMRLLPVIRTMLGAAAAIVTQLGDVRALVWPPSASLIGPNFFVSSVEAWLGGGPFPALGLTAFASLENGAIVSRGLAFFIGQELLIDRSLASDRSSGVRLGIRLADRLIAQGPLSVSQNAAGPDGSSVRLSPSPDQHTVRVTPA